MKDRELAESILKITREHPEYSYNYKQIAAVLGVKDSFIRKRIVTVLEQLSKNGTLEEAFGTGTAVGIAMVEEIGNNDFSIKFPEANPVSVIVNDTLNAMKVQDIEDKFGWIVVAK